MPHWTLGLVGDCDSQRGLALDGPDADLVRAALGPGATSWAGRVGADIADRIAAAIPALREGTAPLDAVRRATTSTTLQALTLVANIGAPDTSLASAEVEVIAGDFARRGMQLNDLLKSIRIGYAVLAAALLDAATHLTAAEERADELRRIAVLLFEELDDFTGVAASAFLKEQAAWAAGVSAERLDLITKIIDNAPVDLTRTQRVLDYPLGGHHVALIVWSKPRSSRQDLRTVVDPLLRRWGVPSATLVIPVGADALWVWGTFGSTPIEPRSEPVVTVEEMYVAVGQLGVGVDGFRDSHLQACAVQRLVGLRRSNPSAVISHDDVALEILLLADVDAAVRFVDRTLGPLADAEPRMADLRSTLRHYLDMDHSLVKVAAVENISKNTVTYRIQKALQICAHSSTPTTDIRAALRIHAWLHG